MAKGFRQKAGVDLTETFSPVAKPTTIRIVLSLAIQFNWPIRQRDVNNAFLNRELKEDVYMYQQRGFVDSQHPDYVCRLHKLLYGLKQAPRARFERFTTHLTLVGCIASSADPSLFVWQSEHTFIILLLYKDDIIVTGINPFAL